MVIARALMGTTLGTAFGFGLGLAGAVTPQVALANQMAAASLSVPAESRPAVIQKGTVLWRRGATELEQAPSPQVGAELQRLQQTLGRIQSETAQQVAQLQAQLQSSQQALAQVRGEQARQQQELASQTAEAVGKVAAMAQESMRSMERVTLSNSDNWGTTNKQLAQLEGRLQTALTDVRQQQASAATQTQNYTDLKVSQAQLETQLAAVREARQAATEAEQRIKAYTGEQLANRDTQIIRLADAAVAGQKLTNAQVDALRATTATQLASTQAVTDERLKAQEALTEARLAAVDIRAEERINAVREHTSTQIAATQALQGAQIAAVSTQLAASQQLTAIQLAELRKLNADTRVLASSEVRNVATALRLYADAQVNQAVATTSATLINLAQATDTGMATLSDQTNRRLGLMWQATRQEAEKLAEQKANAVAASLAALQQQTAAQRITPQQIRSISEQTVADATPEFRALALRTMQEGQDYIRTVARNAVQDKDPGMTEALAEAARDVITKDDRVVFAIRKAVADELQGAVTGVPAGESTQLGPDRTASMGGDVNLDPNRLRIAQLLAPGTNQLAPDAAQLAAIAPAAGPAVTMSADGRQSWSVPGTSLVRARNSADWMDIRQYKVVVHEDNQTLEELLGKVIKHAEPFTGPWQVRWKVSEPNRDILKEKFSLDAETSFEEFVSYLAQYVVNDRGVKLTFSLFDNERIIVVSD